MSAHPAAAAFDRNTGTSTSHRAGPRVAAFIWAFAAATAQAEVTAKDAWVRGTVPAQTSTGAFVTLTSTAEARLVKAASPLAKIVEIHESTTKDGVSRMQAVESVALPAGKPVQLKPGGLHVMLMGLSRPLRPGDEVPLTLTIEEKGGKRTPLAVRAEVRPLGSR